MSRSQSGICQTPQNASLIRVYEVVDMPMNNMSVGQFSVMVHGVIADVLKHYPGDRLQCVVGFGHMFWLLAWHGKRPRRMRPFEDLEHQGHTLPATEGDLWFYLHSNNPQCIRDLIHYMDGHLKDLVTPLMEMDSFSNPEEGTEAGLQGASDPVSDSIFIEPAETDFAGGCFALVQKFDGPSKDALLWAEVLKESAASLDAKNEVLIHSLTPKDDGTLLIMFHRDPDRLDAVWEKALERPDTAERLQAYPPVTGTRFFIPSIDVLTGLRMGGIRMNRFSPTQQFK